MNRQTAFALLGLSVASLAACSATTASDKSYSLGRGVVNYDELRRAGDKCKVEGGALQAKQDGGDPAQLSNYTCVIPKGD
ncbi:MAG: hypothetical protein B7Z44_09740 [Caulobacter sp. 12-67-6]|nr:MAG: hypothetical protein B7Z44_09740 [Caulobacter sp. 12-67-6]OYX73284.1 MAG: hypothetical protein B7Y81_03825 [Caulobacter sp. 32-67-35]OZA76305.1 MAG: hypothetical protein B7X77_06095 [Caulobacter sp. 39-67-4]HQR88716.1 hypothetical protein [Caulobacter sp.]